LETNRPIGQSTPKVKKHPRPVETFVWLSMTLGHVLPRTVGSENTTAISPTFVISSATKDATWQGRCHLHGAHQCEHLLHQGEAHFVLWHPSSGRLPGLTSSSLDRSTNMMALVTLKNSSRSTTRSLKPLMVMIV
jgi:hypothetical protein